MSKAADYSLGKVYVIKNTVNDILYIGSTCSSLGVRLRGHINAARSSKVFFYRALLHIGISKFSIHLIKNFPCTCKNELVDEEMRIVDEYLEESHNLYNAIGTKAATYV